MVGFKMGAKKTKDSYMLRSWRNTLDRLAKETGISLEEVAEYIGAACTDGVPGFYSKMPRRRSTFIGIGMAFNQPVDVINQWITDYARKRKLYVKDISEDLVWLYLINANLYDDSGSTNYYKRYEDYQAVAYAVFRERWDEIVLGLEDTADVEVSLGQADYGPEYDGIKAFVAEHMDAFRSAYAKPRAMLDGWLQQIISTCREHPEETVISSLNSMRGWLDDSMINFLSGDVSTVNVIDRKTGKRTINIKRMPKSRRKYIAMCMALGMTTDDIDRFLEMMGYAAIDVSDSDEGKLLMALTEWETTHPLQRAYKNRYFKKVSGHGLIQERKLGIDFETGKPYEPIEFEVSGDKIQAVHMLPGYTHNIINLSETENLVTLMWANETFDPEKPDTFYEPV